jgi:F0F1-type ATP synthase membrane subunit b/b'
MQIDLAPDPSLLAIMVIFILNYLVVRKYFLQPVNQVLEERESETRTAEALYEDALARFNEAAAQMESQLHLAKREASQLRDRYRGEAASHRQQMIETTNGHARGVIGEAEEKLGREVETAKQQIVREADALARLAAERILGRAV